MKKSRHRLTGQTPENCSHVFLVLHDSDNYTLDDNHLAQWIQGDYYFNGLLYGNFSRPVMCAYPPEFSLTSRDLAILITAMSITSISILASMALLITYSLFRTLRTFPSKVIMNLAAALIAGDVSYIITSSLLLSNKVNSWRIGVIVESYFRYARLMWTALAGFEICRNIYSGIKKETSKEKGKKETSNSLCFVRMGNATSIGCNFGSCGVQ